MANKVINLNDLSLVELKALAYDVILEIESSNSKLAQINQAIAKRQQVATDVPTDGETTDDSADTTGGRPNDRP